MHPAITAAVANQHRRDLITQADAYRLARTARQGRPRSQVSPFLTTKRVIITAAAACTAAARFMLTPAGPAHASAHHVADPRPGQPTPPPTTSQAPPSLATHYAGGSRSRAGNLLLAAARRAKEHPERGSLAFRLACQQAHRRSWTTPWLAGIAAPECLFGAATFRLTANRAWRHNGGYLRTGADRRQLPIVTRFLARIRAERRLRSVEVRPGRVGGRADDPILCR
jgi:hypothetical protein